MQALRYVSWLYIGTLVAASVALGIVASTTTYGKRTGVGCNLYDALFVGAECRGFFGSVFVEFFLGFPLLVAQATAMSIMSPWMLIAAALLLSYCWLKEAHAT
jgi:hypothetical protein